MEITGLSTDRFEGAKAAESWIYPDLAALLDQLDAVGSLTAAPPA